MDARAKTVRQILHSGDQFLVPFFQRHYSWRKKQWRRLREDIFSLAEDDTPSHLHFLGPLVCTAAGHVPGEVPAYQLIDGQQRLTTLTLVLTAIRDVARERGLKDLAEEVMEDFLVHKRKQGLQRYKVVPRLGDREVFVDVLDGPPPVHQHKEGIVQAWQYFREEISKWSIDRQEIALNKLFVAVTERLSLVVITIDGENPYEIFESLNSTGLPLEESDLIRNYLFMQVPIAEQEDFNAAHWASFEQMFDESGKDSAIPQTPFYRAYLMRAGVYSKAGCTFVDFKTQNRERDLAAPAQVAELKRHARYELQIRRPATVTSDELREALSDIALLDITTAHALIHTLMSRHEQGELDETELIGCLRDLASFVLRRSICGDTSRSYAKWFCEAARVKDNPRQDLRAYWMRRGWPDDATFVKRLVEFPLYRREPKKCRLLLERLERSSGHKERVDLSTLSIEHVMPQKIERGDHGKAWQEALGPSWRELHSQWLHTFGNLTLSGYNPELSNRRFVDKQREFADSNLSLNSWFAPLDGWDAETIEGRGHSLAERVAVFWQRPKGGKYTDPRRPETGTSRDERRERYYRYWELLLQVLQQRKALPKMPKPARRTALICPIGVAGFRLIAFVDPEGRAVYAGLVCRGRKARDNFKKLEQDRETIERRIGCDLLWQEAATETTARILVRLGNSDPFDPATWETQHVWLADTLKAFVEHLTEPCRRIVAADPEAEDLDGRRRRFWQTLLDRSAGRTELYKDVSATHQHWLSTGAGLSGVTYMYVVAKKMARVELYIQQGKEAQRENKALFDALRTRSKEIEAAFGERLSWQRLDHRKTCRIAYLMNHGGLGSPEAMWPAIHDAMIDAMIRLVRAFTPEIARLKAKS